MMELCVMQLLEFRAIFAASRILKNSIMQFNYEYNLSMKVKSALY